MNYIYSKNQIVIKRVVDGDTLDVVFDLGFKIFTQQRVRLARIDTPELRSKDQQEREKAHKAKNYVEDKLKEYKELKVVTYKTGKFGRFLVDVFIDGKNLNNELIEKGLAKFYVSKRRSPKKSKPKEV